MPPEDRSKIEELKKSLYSRNAPDIRTKRRLRFNPVEQQEVPTDWQHPEVKPEEAKLNPEYQHKTMAFTTKLFIGSLIFFVVAVGIGAFLISNGENIISANNIDITVNGPVSIAGGEPVVFDVQVANKNNITLEAVDLDVDFPPGTVDPNNRAKELKEFRETVEDIRPGAVGQKRITAIMYGEENTKRQVKVTVTYRVAGSNAVFKKTKDYEVLLSSSPLSLAVTGFKEVTAGQEFELQVTLTSNSSNVMKNLLLRTEYPFGYTLTSTDIKAEGNRSIWKVGDIPPHGKKTLKFKGRLEGQDGEARVFRFSAGAQSASSAVVIGTEYIATTKEISIQKPFISTGITFEGENATGEYNGVFNTPVRTSLAWFNNLPTAVIDGELSVKLSGNAFDKNSVSPGEGYYKSAENSISWNKITTEKLTSIGAGENGSVTFGFTPRNFTTPSRRVTNPTVTVELEVSGKRLSENNVPETVRTSARRTIKISSDLALGSQITRAGAFENTGPIPPKAEQPTTYTVTWTVDNTVNTVSGAEIVSQLPAYMKWTGKISPTTEDITFNNNNNQIVWKVGNVNTFTAGTTGTRKVSFQVSFTPSVAQVGQVPVLVQPSTLVGYDDFTGAKFTLQAQALTTKFNDQNFMSGQEVVAR